MILDKDNISTKTVNYVYQELRHRIFLKEIKANQRLPEISIAKQLNVSRTPIREAFRKLAEEGLVVIRPNDGASTISPSIKDIKDAYEIREQLECFAIKQSVKQITPLQLWNIQKEERIFQERNLEAYLDINTYFHRIIAESSNNKLLADYIENVLKRTYIYMIFYESFFDFDNNPSLDEHRAILAALRKRNEERAIKLMRNHISLSLQQLISIKKEIEEKNQ
jgi:DNA-binding GntR family transcriptional regulator